jgi:hypothetical protein
MQVTVVRVTVANTGPGLPPELTPAACLRCPPRGTQCERKRARLGLATVRRIAEAHGGRAGVHSSPSGCRCWFTLRGRLNPGPSPRPGAGTASHRWLVPRVRPVTIRPVRGGSGRREQPAGGTLPQSRVVAGRRRPVRQPLARRSRPTRRVVRSRSRRWAPRGSAPAPPAAHRSAAQRRIRWHRVPPASLLPSLMNSSSWSRS